MSTLVLKLDGRDPDEWAIGEQPITIGRLPDNTIVIDNPAVSGRHARVYKEGAHCVLEDLRSTNGTFVNDKPIARYTLIDGDQILIGKHTIRFAQQGGAAARPASSAVKPASLLSGLDHGRPSQVYDAVVPKTAIPSAQGRIGTLKVVRGDTGQAQYVLAAVTTMIGKTESAQIRLKGWFKPKNAAAIARRADGFSITPMDAEVVVNGQRVDARRDLANGDVIEVGGLTLQFTLS